MKTTVFANHFNSIRLEIGRLRPHKVFANRFSPFNFVKSSNNRNCSNQTAKKRTVWDYISRKRVFCHRMDEFRMCKWSDMCDSIIKRKHLTDKRRCVFIYAFCISKATKTLLPFFASSASHERKAARVEKGRRHWPKTALSQQEMIPRSNYAPIFHLSIAFSRIEATEGRGTRVALLGIGRQCNRVPSFPGEFRWENLFRDILREKRRQKATKL